MIGDGSAQYHPEQFMNLRSVHSMMRTNYGGLGDEPAARMAACRHVRGVQGGEKAPAGTQGRTGARFLDRARAETTTMRVEEVLGGARDRAQ